MQLPSLLSLTVHDCRGRPVAGLIIAMRITTGQRNPYSILFPKTDETGATKLTAEEVQGRFEDCISEDLMGHFGTLSDASQTVVLSLLEINQLRENLSVLRNWPLMPYEATNWLSREAKLRYLLSARNSSYACQEVSLTLSPRGEIQLQVEPWHGA